MFRPEPVHGTLGFMQTGALGGSWFPPGMVLNLVISRFSLEICLETESPDFQLGEPSNLRFQQVPPTYLLQPKHLLLG